MSDTPLMSYRYGFAACLVATGMVGLLAATSDVRAEDSGDSGTVVAEITNLEHRRGMVRCALHTADDWLESEKAPHRVNRPLPKGETGATCRFEEVDPGTYAVAVLHDEDGNGKPNTNMFGIPQEGIGVSYNNLPSMSAPNFEDAKFELESGETETLSIALEY